MKWQTKLAILGGFAVLIIAACSAGGCASTSNLNGKETYFIGMGRVTEGKAERRFMVGEPASAPNTTEMSSDSMRTVWGQKGGN